MFNSMVAMVISLSRGIEKALYSNLYSTARFLCRSRPSTSQIFAEGLHVPDLGGAYSSQYYKKLQVINYTIATRGRGEVYSMNIAITLLRLQYVA